jgi:hypothetical protein
MATIQSTLSRFQTSAPASRSHADVLVTTVTPIRPPASRQPAPRPSNLLSLPKEPEDARLTGGTRSLDRRLLALNLNFSGIKKPVFRRVSVADKAMGVPRSAA